MSTPRELSPEDQAKSLYNDGIREVRKADGYQAVQPRRPIRKRRKKRSARHTTTIRRRSPSSCRPPNSIPTCTRRSTTSVTPNRKLGNYDIALSAYERALALHPGYPEALEYRGEAFLV